MVPKKLEFFTGVLGFEPRNGGTKTRCLTTWRHPIAFHLNNISSYSPLNVNTFEENC